MPEHDPLCDVGVHARRWQEEGDEEYKATNGERDVFFHVVLHLNMGQNYQKNASCKSAGGFCIFLWGLLFVFGRE